MAIKRRLEIEYHIDKMSIPYEEKTIPWVNSWGNAEFTSSKDFTANIKLWKDGIEPERISETLKELRERAESFRVALKYLGNHHISFKEKDWPTYYFDNQELTIRNEEEIAILIDYLHGKRESYALCNVELPTPNVTGSGTTSPILLPQRMPSIPSNIHWMAETLVVAGEQINYPDLMLKLAFLIIEGLKAERDFDENETKFKLVRDFVSHPTCNFREVVKFIEAELPTAKIDNKVQFKRDKSDHISFVSKYAHQALQRAKELFEEKAQKDGGFIKS